MKKLGHHLAKAHINYNKIIPKKLSNAYNKYLPSKILEREALKIHEKYSKLPSGQRKKINRRLKLTGKVGVGLAGAVASMYAGQIAGVTTRLAGDQIASNIENTLSKNSRKARDARRT